MSCPVMINGINPPISKPTMIAGFVKL